jgi:hypothetical protein
VRFVNSYITPSYSSYYSSGRAEQVRFLNYFITTIQST